MIISENTILYFTVTGNSLQIAKDVGKELGDFDLLSIPRIKDAEEEIEVTSNYLGIVSPVYFWGLPRKVNEFFKKIKANNNTYIFAIANCALQPGQALMQIPMDTLFKSLVYKVTEGFKEKDKKLLG